MNDGGSIIITSSISAVMGTPFEGLYGATKAGVCVARPQRGDRPRPARHPRQRGPARPDVDRPEPDARGADRDDRAARAQGPRRGPRRASTSCSPPTPARYITGQAISVDGGITAGMSQALLGRRRSHDHRRPPRRDLDARRRPADRVLRDSSASRRSSTAPGSPATRPPTRSPSLRRLGARQVLLHGEQPLPRAVRVRVAAAAAGGPAAARQRPRHHAPVPRPSTTSTTSTSG